MIITGMAHFQSVCKKKMVEWYNKNGLGDAPLTPPIDLSNVFVVWSCKTLQNYKCLVSTTVSGDGIYAEYTYKGDGYLYQNRSLSDVFVFPNGRDGKIDSIYVDVDTAEVSA